MTPPTSSGCRVCGRPVEHAIHAGRGHTSEFLKLEVGHVFKPSHPDDEHAATMAEAAGLALVEAARALRVGAHREAGTRLGNAVALLKEPLGYVREKARAEAKRVHREAVEDRATVGDGRRNVTAADRAVAPAPRLLRRKSV